MDSMNTPLNMFISYSHKDEVFVNEFKKHLITLKKKNVIDAWHDRELIAGDNFDEEIREKLTSADLVGYIRTSQRIIITSGLAI